MTKLPAEDLSCFLMLELSLFDHRDDSIIDSFAVLESHHHFLLKLGVRNLGSNGDSSLDGFFDLPA
jgi:hypothetical protein